MLHLLDYGIFPLSFLFPFLFPYYCGLINVRLQFREKMPVLQMKILSWEGCSEV